jgi:hypothetical protein
MTSQIIIEKLYRIIHHNKIEEENQCVEMHKLFLYCLRAHTFSAY